MIYEIVVRGHKLQAPSDNLIWVETNLPTRAFEQWLLDRAFLSRSRSASLTPIVRWRIVQTTRPAHFVLATDAADLEERIRELVNPPVQTKKATGPAVQVLPNFGMSAFSWAA